MMFHAEMEPDPENPIAMTPVGDHTAHSSFLKSRPQILETHAINTIISLSSEAPLLPLHIVHLSAAAGVPLIESAREKGVQITAETCFHYLAITAESIPNRATDHKCCPPIREASNREVLWEALKGGIISSVVSDHSPCTVGLKLLEKGDFFQAWGGICTLGLGLSVLWTEGQKRGVTLEKISYWTSEQTSKHLGLDHVKGTIAAGKDADFVIFDPDAEFTVSRKDMQFKNKLTPWQGRTLKGRVVETFLRGHSIFHRDTGYNEPQGNLILEKRRFPDTG